MKKYLYLLLCLIAAIVIFHQVDFLGFGQYTDCSRTQKDNPQYCAWRYGFAYKVYLTP